MKKVKKLKKARMMQECQKVLDQEKVKLSDFIEFLKCFYKGDGKVVKIESRGYLSSPKWYITMENWETYPVKMYNYFSWVNEVKGDITLEESEN